MEAYTLLMLFFITAPNDLGPSHHSLKKDIRIWAFQSSSTVSAGNKVWCQHLADAMGANVNFTDTTKVIAFCLPKDAAVYCADNPTDCRKSVSKGKAANPKTEGVYPEKPQLTLPSSKTLSQSLRAVD